MRGVSRSYAAHYSSALYVTYGCEQLRGSCQRLSRVTTATLSCADTAAMSYAGLRLIVGPSVGPRRGPTEGQWVSERLPGYIIRVLTLAKAVSRFRRRGGSALLSGRLLLHVFAAPPPVAELRARGADVLVLLLCCFQIQGRYI